MAGLRQLVVVADDFGIGPETDRGILELAKLGRITGTVLLVNSPFAEAAVAAWNHAGRPVELGWHPVITLDKPLLPPDQVPGLVDSTGQFHPLGRFLRKSLLGRINGHEVFAELTAQYERFLALVGEPPKLVNSHQHASLFSPVGRALDEVLIRAGRRPFVRRVREPWAALAKVPGARIKRAVLNGRGRRQARRLDSEGFPGCDWLAGITDPACVANPAFHRRWLFVMPGQSVELMCHPGHLDSTLIGRDAPAEDGNLWRRVHELEALQSDDFLAVVRDAGFELTPPSRIGRPPLRIAA
jgi:predicted glycoside hydrolase/deacetylase ChbG (UPF0249 family)